MDLRYELGVINLNQCKVRLKDNTEPGLGEVWIEIQPEP